MIERVTKGYSKTTADISGWCTHYVVGTLFVILYNELWKERKVKPSLASGLILGAVSGVAGVAGWQSVFEIHPNPPAKNLKKYFGHLLIAHVVFGIFSAVTYKTLTDKNSG